MKLEVDRDRLISEIETLASISDAAAPAVTRIVFSERSENPRVAEFALRKRGHSPSGCHRQYLCALDRF